MCPWRNIRGVSALDRCLRNVQHEVMAGVPDDRIVDEVVGRLATRYPGLSKDFLAKRVWECLTSFVNPAIRDFLPVLVERRVTHELKVASF